MGSSIPVVTIIRCTLHDDTRCEVNYTKTFSAVTLKHTTFQCISRMQVASRVTSMHCRHRVCEAYHDLYNLLPRQGSSHLLPGKHAVRLGQPGAIHRRYKLHALVSGCLLACFLAGMSVHAHHVDDVLEHVEHMSLLKEGDVHSPVEDG